MILFAYEENRFYGDRALEKESVELLINELLALRGRIEDHQIRLLALEKTFRSNPEANDAYSRNKGELENTTLYVNRPLEVLEELRAALLQDHSK